ncbi:MAG: hypothetical protein WBP85_01175 [Terracidiphilus sp.]
MWNAFYPDLDWDAKLYLHTIHSIQAGHDPYQVGISALNAYQSQPALQSHERAPVVYMYSPITIPLLRTIGSFPPILYIWGYWLIYAAGVLAQIWVSMQATEPAERRIFVFLAPAAAFFPGLIQVSTLMDGNVAYILYGLVFVTAYLGWRRGRWSWFYLATLAVSCCKVPMLSLLAIPVLSARRQWLPASITAAAGIALFLIQPWIWPSSFHNYLSGIELGFSYYHAFGVGPAGLLGYALCDAGLPYHAASTVFYVFYALALFGLLFYLSRQFLDGKLSLRQWMPVLITGVILLNPRVIEYDFAPLTLFLALILFRTIASFAGTKRAIVFSFLFFGAINAAVLLVAPIDTNYTYLNYIQGFVLIGIAAAGFWNLLRQTRGAIPNRISPAAVPSAIDSGA